MPNAEATAAITAAATRRSEARTSPLPRQAPPRPAIGFRGCMDEVNASLSSQQWPLVPSDRLNEARAIVSYAFRLPSRHRTTPLLMGALACHLAINCGLGLLLRNAG